MKNLALALLLFFSISPPIKANTLANSALHLHEQLGATNPNEDAMRQAVEQFRSITHPTTLQHLAGLLRLRLGPCSALVALLEGQPPSGAPLSTELQALSSVAQDLLRASDITNKMNLLLAMYEQASSLARAIQNIRFIIVQEARTQPMTTPCPPGQTAPLQQALEALQVRLWNLNTEIGALQAELSLAFPCLFQP